jgi:hypothetical protein
LRFNPISNPAVPTLVNKTLLGSGTGDGLLLPSKSPIWVQGSVSFADPIGLPFKMLLLSTTLNAVPFRVKEIVEFVNPMSLPSNPFAVVPDKITVWPGRIENPPAPMRLSHRVNELAPDVTVKP